MPTVKPKSTFCVCIGDNESEEHDIPECLCEQTNEQECKVKHLWQKIQEMGKFLKHDDSSESSSSSSSGEEDSAPDGGWGWAVCFGSFLINFVLDGTMFSFGVLLIELLDYFGEGKAKTAWVGSSLLGMSMLMGPIVSMLLERYSCRQITIAGTLISVVAFIISTFSPSIEILIVTYGILGGIGFCMSFVSAIIVVGAYFSHKRAIATGIAMSGSGLGTFAYAYLTNILISQYDWRGTVLILSGILLNGVFCGLLFRPLPESKLDCSRSEDNSLDASDIAEIKTLLKKSPLDSIRHSKMPSRLALSSEFTITRKDNMLLPEANGIKSFLSQHDFRKDLKPISNQMSRTDIFYSGSLARLSHHQKSAVFSSHPGNLNSVETEESSREKSHFHAFWDGMKKNMKLFNNKVFVLLLLTNVGWTGWATHKVTCF